ncbi:MAG: glycoside hydrolase family 5 protein [Treponema sp.]|nr:glycoside hydrolase family 5 protein [Treponema sp.]
MKLFFKKKLSIAFSVLFAASLLISGCNPTVSTPNQNVDKTPGENPSGGSQSSDDGKTYSNTVDFAKNLVIGWNLGNTMDAPKETDWGMPKTTKDMIKAVKNAGFKTIRIPVSWSTHVSGSDYKIDSAWMTRVKEIVDWALEEDLYVILNVHHDNYYAGASSGTTKGLSDSSVSGFAITTDQTLQTKSKAYLKSVWNQIATEFSSYGNKLIFEVLNEPRTVNESTEWYISSTSAAKPFCEVITSYEQVCVDTIRSVSGNENRYLMVPGYAASGSDSNLLKAYTMPNDSSNKLLLSVHAYSPYNFCMANADSTFGADDQSSLDSIFNYLKTNYTDKGIGAVMGEASASNKGNDEERIKWAKYYFAKAKDAGIPVVLWDNMVESVDSEQNGEHHGWLHRNSGKWFFPDIIKAMMDTVGVTGYSIPKYVAATLESIGWNESNAQAVSVTSMGLENWGFETNKMSKSSFTNAKAGSILKITFASNAQQVEFVNSDWNYRVSTSASTNIISGNDLYYVLTSEDATKWKAEDISIVGSGFTVTAVKFMN